MGKLPSLNFLTANKQFYLSLIIGQLRYLTNDVFMDKIFRLALVFLLLVRGTNSIAQIEQIDSVVNRIILVGDAGELTNGGHPELELLKKAFYLDERKNTIVFLGDNIYPLGLPSQFASNYDRKKKVLDDQVNVVKG